MFPVVRVDPVSVGSPVEILRTRQRQAKDSHSKNKVLHLHPTHTACGYDTRMRTKYCVRKKILILKEKSYKIRKSLKFLVGHITLNIR